MGQARKPAFSPGRLLRTSLTKWQIKAALGAAAFFMVTGVLIYTQVLVQELEEREEKTVSFFADIYRHYIANPESNTQDFLFLIDRVTPAIPFPVVFTDTNDIPNEPFAEYTRNVRLDSSLSIETQRSIMRDVIQEMAETYPPIVIRDAQGTALQKIFYANSELIARVRVLPFVEIIIVTAFVLVGYIAFSYIRRNEESNVWVGMAKEAAHQLGTPLSSLLAWIEIARMNADEREALEQTLSEMEHDLARLNVIAIRFSKIGSEPIKKPEDLSQLIEKVCSYFERRVPHLGKKVSIRRTLPQKAIANVNADLFEWLIENLLKNGVEAIDSDNGSVTVNLSSVSAGRYILTVVDTGKGMSTKVRRQIFLPGYTTKKRGWGLGLSLCKRIVEEYHGGRIYVKDSSPGKGTTFVVEM